MNQTVEWHGLDHAWIRLIIPGRRVLLYGAIPSITWSLLPIWMVIALCFLFAVSGHSPSRAPLRLLWGVAILSVSYIPLFIAKLSNGWLADLMPVFGLLTISLFVLWVMNRAAEEAEEKYSRAWSYLLPLVALAPHPAALVSLVALLLLRAGPDSILYRFSTPTPRLELLPSLGMGVISFAAAFLLSFALPAQSILGSMQQALWQATAVQGSGRQIYQQPKCRMMRVNGKWELMGGTAGNWYPIDPKNCSFDPTSLLQIGAAMTSPAPQPLNRQTQAALAGALVLALVVWRARRTTVSRKPLWRGVMLAKEAVSGGSSVMPQHRVRAAYARTEAHLAGLGLTRQDSETPAEYLRRAASRWPDLAESLAALSGAYAPVRYGSGVSDAQADTAEAAAHAILNSTCSTDSLVSAQD